MNKTKREIIRRRMLSCSRFAQNSNQIALHHIRSSKPLIFLLSEGTNFIVSRLNIVIRVQSGEGGGGVGDKIGNKKSFRHTTFFHMSIVKCAISFAFG